MSEETPQPKSYFGRILGLNLAVVLLLHGGRQLLDPAMGIFVGMFALMFINFMLTFFFVGNREGDNAFACLLSAFLVALVGVSDCGTHP